jgi:hypothetical protein
VLPVVARGYAEVVRALGHEPVGMGPIFERDGTSVRLLGTSLTEVAGAARLECADGALWILESEPA